MAMTMTMATTMRQHESESELNDRTDFTESHNSTRKTKHSTSTGRTRNRNLSSWKTAVFQSLGASFTLNDENNNNENENENENTKNKNNSSIFLLLGNDQYWIKRQPSQHRRRQRQQQKRREEAAGSSSHHQRQTYQHDHHQQQQQQVQNLQQQHKQRKDDRSSSSHPDSSNSSATNKNQKKKKNRRSWIPIFRRQKGDNKATKYPTSATATITTTTTTTTTRAMERPNDSLVSPTSRTFLDFHDDDAMESPLLAAVDNDVDNDIDDDSSEYVPRLYPDIEELLSLTSPRTTTRATTTTTTTRKEKNDTKLKQQYTDACTQTSFSISSEQKRQWEDNLATRMTNVPPPASAASTGSEAGVVVSAKTSSAGSKAGVMVCSKTPSTTKSLVVSCPKSEFQTPHRRTPSSSVNPTSRSSSHSGDNTNKKNHNKKRSLPSKLPLEDSSKSDNDDTDEGNTTRQHHKYSVARDRRQKSSKNSYSKRSYHHHHSPRISITHDQHRSSSSALSFGSPRDKNNINHKNNKKSLRGGTSHSDNDDKIRELYLSQIRKGRRNHRTGKDHNVHHERNHQEHGSYHDRLHGDDGTVCSLKHRQSRIHSQLEKKTSPRRDFVMSWQPKSNVVRDDLAMSGSVTPAEQVFYKENIQYKTSSSPTTPSRTGNTERRGKRPRPIQTRTSELIRHFDNT